MNAANRSTTRRKHMEEKKKPVHEITLGRIRVAIWANKSNGKGVWFNTTIVRLYKDGDAMEGNQRRTAATTCPLCRRHLTWPMAGSGLQATAQSDESNE